MPPLTANLRTRLRDVLLRAFDEASLKQLVRTHLDRGEHRLDVLVNTDQSFEAIVFELIEVAEQRGYVEDLVRGAQAERGHRPDVAELAALLGLTPRTGPTPPRTQVPTNLRDSVIRLNEQFQQRKLQFRYLSGYKQLHDGLHTLQDLQVGIASAGDRFRAAPDDRLELETIAEQLQDLAREARASAALLEDPEDVADWLGAFERAAGDLVRATQATDHALLARVVETLGQLPNQQAGLNAELVRCAKRLRPMALVEMMDGILAVMAPVGAAVTPFVAEFRAGLGRFRALCDRLATLIRDHDACQDVETELAQAATVPDVTPAGMTGWAAVKDHLAGVAARRPDDALAAKTAESVGLFETAAAAGNQRQTSNEFTRLIDRFHRLFNRTDKELLDITDRLVQEAAYLDVQLRTATHVSI